MIASSFGSNSIEFDPHKFLPIQFEDSNSPSAILRRKLGSKTIEVVKQLLKDEVVPAKVSRDLFLVEGTKELFLDKD